MQLIQGGPRPTNRNLLKAGAPSFVGWRLGLKKKGERMFQTRAARGVGQGFVLGCKVARGGSILQFQHPSPPAAGVQDSAGMAGWAPPLTQVVWLWHGWQSLECSWLLHREWQQPLESHAHVYGCV